MQHATCTAGPSFPTLSPDAIASGSPTLLITSVHTLRKPSMINPESTHLISLIPLPAAYGAKALTSSAQTHANTAAVAIHTTYAPSAPSAHSTHSAHVSAAGASSARAASVPEALVSALCRSVTVVEGAGALPCAAAAAIPTGTLAAPGPVGSICSQQQNFLLSHQPVEQYPCFRSDAHSVTTLITAMLTPINRPA